MFCFAGCQLPYYLPIYLLELTLLCVLLVLQIICVKITELDLHLLGFMLIVPSIMTTVYFLVWQQYILYIELILVSFKIGFQSAYALSALSTRLMR